MKGGGGDTPHCTGRTGASVLHRQGRGGVWEKQRGWVHRLGTGQFDFGGLWAQGCSPQVDRECLKEVAVLVGRFAPRLCSPL